MHIHTHIYYPWLWRQTILFRFRVAYILCSGKHCENPFILRIYCTASRRVEQSAFKLAYYYIFIGTFRRSSRLLSGRPELFRRDRRRQGREGYEETGFTDLRFENTYL